LIDFDKTKIGLYLSLRIISVINYVIYVRNDIIIMVRARTISKI